MLGVLLTRMARVEMCTRSHTLSRIFGLSGMLEEHCLATPNGLDRAGSGVQNEGGLDREATCLCIAYSHSPR